MEKTFREVIADIKPGQTWGDGCITITKTKASELRIHNKITNSVIWIFPSQRFKLEKKPVTFKAVLHSDKKCRVEHKLLEDESKFKSYDYLGSIMFFLSDTFGDIELKRILKEGKWYLED